MRAILVGAVESTRVALRAIAGSAEWRLDSVVTLPVDLAERHSDFVDLRDDARAAGAEIVAASDCNQPDVVRGLAERQADHVFVIGWSQICRPAFLKAAGRGAIGYHPAALPRMRGRAVIPWAILLDEKITASTLFWIDAGTDTGDILAQRFFHLAADETAQTLYDRHMAALGDLLSQTLPRLARGETPRVPQQERYATWCAKRIPDDGLIDWGQSGEAVWRLVRAVGRPYPGAFTTCLGSKLKIWSAYPGLTNRGRHAALPGQIVEMAADRFTVRCGDGSDLHVEHYEWADDIPHARRLRLHARLGT